MGRLGVTVIDKKGYLERIKNGVFGGVPRTIKIEAVDESGTIASVKVRIESSENNFISYNSLLGHG